MDNIQEVINELLRMKKEYNAPQACSVQSQQRNQYRSECLHIALAALREKQERESGCKYCNAELASVYRKDWTIFTKGEDKVVDINFCPICGQRLEAEL